MEHTKSIKSEADRLLHEFGLLDILSEYGKPHIIGSCRMDMMAWNDLDIDIENDGMTTERLYELTVRILSKFRPTWYEAKEVTDENGKKVWFYGFETMITGSLWNFDLWFFDLDTIHKAEAFCDHISETATSLQKEAVIAIKQALIGMNRYSFDQFTSMDVYDAVMNKSAVSIEDFLRLHQ